MARMTKTASTKTASVITIEQKAKFCSLAGQLSPENLCCDGELRGRALMAKKRRLDAEWAALEKEVGRKVTEDETWKWDAEVSAHEEAERQKLMASMPTHPLLSHGPRPGIWSRIDGEPYGSFKGSYSAYQIRKEPGRNFGGMVLKPDTHYSLSSEFASMILGRAGDKIGEYDTLEEAVAAGEAFLKSVTLSALQKAKPTWGKILEREINQRMPRDMVAAALAN